MGAIIAYTVRLVGYALFIGIPVRVGEVFWERAALDQVDILRAPHDFATATITIAPFVLAFFGFGALRNAAVFIAMYLVGAALTAPFALARLGTAG